MWRLLLPFLVFLSSNSRGVAAQCVEATGVNASSSSPAADTATRISFKTAVVPRQLVVTWNGYYDVKGHSQLLHHALRTAKMTAAELPEWTIVERDNVATREYPSDFTLVQARCAERQEQDTCIQLFIDRLQLSKLVKSVTLQRQVQRNLLGREAYGNEGLPKRQLSFFDGESAGATNGDSGNEPFLADLLNGDVVPLPSHKQLTSLFEADVLWKKGITGLGVKVAVFDTGLRKNHPHFRRIRDRTNWTNEPVRIFFFFLFGGGGGGG